MWIILITKLPTDPSPPKMSIHWSTAWPNEEYARRQQERLESEYLDDMGDFFVDTLRWGKEPNWADARQILYKEEVIRIFPHEFNAVGERMKLYVVGEGESEPSHHLVPSTVAEERLLRDVKTGVRKEIYDAALMDGCTHAQALMVAWGKDITLDDFEVPAIGWYRCRREYAELFCYENELME